MLTKKKRRIEFFDVVVYFIAALLFAIVAYPLILVVSSSISDPQLVSTGQIILLPKKVTFAGYREILKNKDILVGFVNSVFYMVLGTALDIFVTVPAGYVLTKTQLPGHKFFKFFFMFTMYFSGGIIPSFLLVKGMGLYDNRLVLIILGAFSMYNCIICRSFFSSMPKALEESAANHGSSVIGTFFRIILPLSKALLGVMVLYFAVQHWNSYFDAMIYIKDDSMQTLQVILRRILVLAQQLAKADEAGEYAQQMANYEALIRYATIVVSSLPLMIAYPFVQKYFDKGVMLGSVKG